MKVCRAQSQSSSPGDVQRRQLRLQGIVQGVGFRPFVYRLARELRLGGWVQNSPQGVCIEVEGPARDLADFRRRLQEEGPPLSSVVSCDEHVLPPAGESRFEIRGSDDSGQKMALVLPDIATCPACLGEILDPANRRYLYPFTNCTHCGPRYSIVEALPYDRVNTTMRGFEMCAACRREYEDPADRRFHAQPNACPECGPHTQLWDAGGGVLAERHAAVQAAAEAVRQGRVLAVKGLGGFHLVVDAGSAAAVETLRRRKHRDEKPLALMVPDLEQVRAVCEVSAPEAELLASPRAPIVLLRRRGCATLAEAVAPGNPCLGVMLPYTPLHHILMREIARPVVATSGNLSDEPICIEEREALQRLRGIADVLLVHDRPITRHVDDSVARCVLDEVTLLRRARGYAPAPLWLASEEPEILALGAHLKNTVAVARGRCAFISQHIGDLETTQAYDAFHRTIESLCGLYEATPRVTACDMHPDYLSTRAARTRGQMVRAVQHHHAHVAACMVEHGLEGPVLGVSWDGTGYGPDGTVWGGEFLLSTLADYQRVARLRHFRLPGGDKAVVEPRRAAIGVLYEIFRRDVVNFQDLPPVRAFAPAEMRVLLDMLTGALHAPQCSSMGRLFDAVAALIGLRQEVRHEGQAAMELEFLQSDSPEQSAYPYDIVEEDEGGAPLVLDWEPLVRCLIADVQAARPAAHMAARFHSTLVEMIVAVARRCGGPGVVLTGGCFQNATLLRRAALALRAAGFEVYWPREVPANDGGIALGQIAVARAGQAIDRR